MQGELLGIWCFKKWAVLTENVQEKECEGEEDLRLADKPSQIMKA